MAKVVTDCFCIISHALVLASDSSLHVSPKPQRETKVPHATLILPNVFSLLDREVWGDTKNRPPKPHPSPTKKKSQTTTHSS